MLMGKLLAVFCRAFGKYPAGNLPKQQHLLLSIYFRLLREKVFLGHESRTGKAGVSRIMVFFPQEGSWSVFLAVNTIIPSQHQGHSSRQEERERYSQINHEGTHPNSPARDLGEQAWTRGAEQGGADSDMGTLALLLLCSGAD